MTWSYSLTTLGTNSKDDVRLLIGDTVSTDPQFQDEEINYFLSKRPNTYGAAAECCRALAAKFARMADQSAGDTSIKYSQAAKALSDRANGFEAQAANSGAGTPYAGGISVTDKATAEDDTDRVAPQFVLGADDNYLPIAPVPVNPTKNSLP